MLSVTSASISLGRASHVAKLKVRDKGEYSGYGMSGENDYILNNNQHLLMYFMKKTQLDKQSFLFCLMFYVAH